VKRITEQLAFEIDIYVKRGRFNGRNAILWASGATTICCGLEQEPQSKGNLAKPSVFYQAEFTKA
jgi:hypothetical protein